MENKPYFTCSLFEKHIESYKNFSFIQEELLLEKNDTFKKINVEYKCELLTNIEKIDQNLPLAIIPVKDNSQLLLFTLENIKKYNLFDKINFIIVDDRSTEDLYQIASKYKCSFIKVNNKKGFNFSMLNNIAIKIAKDRNIEHVILWNSDLWTQDEDTVPAILDLHRKYNSTISGTKLVYPEFSWNGVYETESINLSFRNMSNKFRGTVQFAGSLFNYNQQLGTFLPLHWLRFQPTTNNFANANKPEIFITGAFQIIETDWIFQNGGFNPSLSKNFQDVDLCLRAVEQDKKVMFFGEGLQLYHDESVTIIKDKFNNQMSSDMVLYSKIWSKDRFLKNIYRVE